MREPTIRDWITQASKKLAAYGADAPLLDSKGILTEVTGLDSAQLISGSDTLMDKKAIDAADSMLERRLSGEPLHRILGWRDFYGRRFEISSETLVPRPDTETLIDSVLATYKEHSGALKILDMGTGTGNIGVTLAAELPSAFVVIGDISPDALTTATKNAARHQVSNRVKPVETDLFEGISGRFDLIVSNPPYIPQGEVASLQTEVRLHDPLRALAGGDDGLVFYRRLFGESVQYLEPGGQVFVEIGEGQAGQVQNIAEQNGFEVWQITADLAGIQRVLNAGLVECCKNTQETEN